MQTLSPRFRSRKFFLWKIIMRRNLFTSIYGDLYGDAMLVLIWIGTSMVAGNQQKPSSVTAFSAKALIFLLKNSKTLK